MSGERVQGATQAPGGEFYPPEADLGRLAKWRLLLGEQAAPRAGEVGHVELEEDWRAADQVVDELYEADRRGGLARSTTKLTRWLGRLRENYPPEAVTLMQRDAIERYDITRLLAEPEILDTLEPNIHLAATLMQLGKLLPDNARAAAERIVRDIAARLAQKLEEPLLRALRSAVASAELRTQGKPTRHTDWNRTILANLKHYRPELGTLVPERFVNRQPRGRGLRNVHILIDQSASMATSAIHAALGAAIMAKVPALRVRLVAFDTELVDLSDLLHDPVETLFGVQLGGGTDIHRALRYEGQFIREPSRSLLLLISDLFEGGSKSGTLRRVASMVQSGVRVVCLLAINDEGKPDFDKAFAAQLTELGAVVFSTTPELFPEMMAAALRGRPLA